MEVLNVVKPLRPRLGCDFRDGLSVATYSQKYINEGEDEELAQAPGSGGMLMSMSSWSSLGSAIFAARIVVVSMEGMCVSGGSSGSELKATSRGLWDWWGSGRPGDRFWSND